MSDRAVSEAEFERALSLMDERNFTGFPTQYPPISCWKSGVDQARLLGAWKKAAHGALPPQLYVNLPFCKTRCTFCFLPVVVSDKSEDLEAYLAALGREEALWRPVFAGRAFSSIYVGGGSPSLLGRAQLERFFADLRSAFRPAPRAQIAFEANPALLDREKVRALKAAGVNWLSLGVQTLNPALTEKVERWQTNESVFRAYAAARTEGIAGVNIDLLCGLEGQSKRSFLFDVRAVARLKPDQVHLNLFEGTRYTVYRQRGNVQSRDSVGAGEAMRREGREILRAAGYQDIDDESLGLGAESCNRQASMSQFQRRVPILGIGSGAVSYLPGAWRQVNQVNLSACRAALERGRLPTLLACRLSPPAERVNFILNALVFSETASGSLLERDFRAQFREPAARRFGGAFSGLVRAGALLRTPEGWRLNPALPEASLRVKRAFMEPSVVREILADSKAGRRDV